MPDPIWKDQSIPKNKRILATVLLFAGAAIGVPSGILLIFSVIYWPSMFNFLVILMVAGWVLTVPSRLIAKKYRKK